MQMSYLPEQILSVRSARITSSLSEYKKIIKFSYTAPNERINHVLMNLEKLHGKLQPIFTEAKQYNGSYRLQNLRFRPKRGIQPHLSIKLLHLKRKATVNYNLYPNIEKRKHQASIIQNCHFITCRTAKIIKHGGNLLSK